MNYGELVTFLVSTQKYTYAEAFAEADSLISEWQFLQISDFEGTVYRIVYDADSDSFTVTDNF
jgi:hypothetical protein